MLVFTPPPPFMFGGVYTDSVKVLGSEIFVYSVNPSTKSSPITLVLTKKN